MAIGSCATTQNAGNSIDWVGTYTGRIPSASGPGIDVEIILFPNETISITYMYVNREGFITGVHPFRWDKTGNKIISELDDYPRYYMVGKDYLLQLDMEGNIITGNLADQYVLKKQ
jgi:uncharacterized lipoprotein NlpE involved in copper resistance